MFAAHGIIVRLVRTRDDGVISARRSRVLLQHPLDRVNVFIERHAQSSGHIGARVRTRDTRMQETLSDARKPALYYVLRAVFKPEFIRCQDSFIPGVVAERNGSDSSLLYR